MIYLVYMSTEIEKQGLGELATVHSIVLAKVLTSDRSGVDVKGHLPVVGTSLKDITTERYKVVQRWQHLCAREAL